MPKYSVALAAKAEIYTFVEVEADSPEEAKHIALDINEMGDFKIDWDTVDGIDFVGNPEIV